LRERAAIDCGERRGEHADLERLCERGHALMLHRRRERRVTAM
jgi:hypothetical protein